MEKEREPRSADSDKEAEELWRIIGDALARLSEHYADRHGRWLRLASACAVEMARHVYVKARERERNRDHN